MDKIFISGVFLYEGFVSKRSPERNRRKENHCREIECYFRVIETLRYQEVSNLDHQVWENIFAQYQDVHGRNVMFEIRDGGKGLRMIRKDAADKLRIGKIGIQPIDVR